MTTAVAGLGQPYCPDCRYDRTGLSPDRPCPECGRALEPGALVVDAWRQGQRPSRIVFALGVIFVLVLGTITLRVVMSGSTRPAIVLAIATIGFGAGVANMAWRVDRDRRGRGDTVVVLGRDGLSIGRSLLAWDDVCPPEVRRTHDGLTVRLRPRRWWTIARSWRLLFVGERDWAIEMAAELRIRHALATGRGGRWR